MSDKANVNIVDGNSSVYLYTHWGGHHLPEALRVALDSPAARNRWADAQYLARIVFCHLVPRDRWGDETGFGITSKMYDNEYPVLIVDCVAQEVRMHPMCGVGQPALARWPIAEYVAQPRAEWPRQQNDEN